MIVGDLRTGKGCIGRPLDSYSPSGKAMLFRQPKLNSRLCRRTQNSGIAANILREIRKSIAFPLGEKDLLDSGKEFLK